MRTFRNIFRFLTPSWLHSGDGELVLYSLALLKDAYLERLRQGHLAQYPSTSPEDGLTRIGRDRAIPRGRDESAERYAARLIEWRYPRGHRVRGSAWALLRQVYHYFGQVAAYTIDVSGNQFTIDTDGTEGHADGVTWDWDGEPATPNWARFWLVLGQSDGVEGAPDWGDADLWGGSYPAPEYAVGLVGFSPSDRRAVHNLLWSRQPWRPAGTRAEWLVFDLDGGGVMPDGTWGDWSANVGGTQVPTRDRTKRYVALADELLEYRGDPTNAPERITLVDGTVYTPNPANAPATIPLPDGTNYTPNPDNAPSFICLVDDGMPAN